MAWLNGNKIAWVYTAGIGGPYRVRATKAITDQVNGESAVLVGGSATNASTYPVITRYMRAMRAVKCTCSGQPDKWVPVYAPGAPLLTPGTSINLNSGTDSHSYESTADQRGESYKRAPGITDTD